MGRPYRGAGCVSRHLRDIVKQSACIMVRVEPHRVNFFTKIIEACSHLAFIFPVNTREGILALYVTPDNMAELSDVVHNFPYGAEIIDS